MTQPDAPRPTKAPKTGVRTRVHAWRQRRTDEHNRRAAETIARRAQRDADRRNADTARAERATLAGNLATLWPAIVAAFVGVLAIAFVMSYHGLFVFGDLIMRWTLALAALAPVGVDVFSMLCLLATFLTRDAHWRIRIYCWVAFLATVAVSIGGNAVSAYVLLDRDATGRGEHLTWGYQQVSAITGAALWPALSAVALHVLIVVRRHLDEQRDKVRQAARDAAIRAEREAVEAQWEADADTVLQARALVLAAEGATAAAIVADLQVPESKRRSIERLTQPIRDALAARQPAVAAKAPTARRSVTRRVDPDNTPTAGNPPA